MQKNQNKISFAEKRLVYINTRNSGETPTAIPAATRAEDPAEREAAKKRQEDRERLRQQEEALRAKAEAKANNQDKANAVERLDKIDTSTPLSGKEIIAALKKESGEKTPTREGLTIRYVGKGRILLSDSSRTKLAEGEKLESRYENGAEKIWESQKEKKNEFMAKLQAMEKQFGISVDTDAFEKKIIKYIATYAQNTHDFDDFTGMVNLATGENSWVFHPIDFMNLINLRSALGGIETMVNLQNEKIQESLGKLPKEELESRSANLPALIAKVNPDFVKDGKLQPAILDYILAGNDLLHDITIVNIADKWENMQPNFAQLEKFTGKKVDEKASLESLGELAEDPNELIKFENKSKDFMEIFASFSNFQFGNQSIDKEEIKKIIGAEFGGGEKINLVELVQNPPTKLKEFAEKLKALNTKIGKIQKTVSGSLEKFGAKLPSLNSVIGLIGAEGVFKPEMLRKALDNPDGFEKDILEKIKAKFPNNTEIQALKNLDDLDKALGKYFEMMEAQLDESILAIFTSGFEIKSKEPGKKPIEINFDKEKIEALLPKIRKQLLPILSESIAKQTGKPPFLSSNGEIDLKNVEKIIENENIKLVLKFFNETKGDKAKVKEFINSEDPEKIAAKEAVSAFCGNVFDTILNSKNPEIVEVRAEVAKIAPPNVKDAIGEGILKEAVEDTFKELQEAFKKGEIGGIFEALMNVLGEIMSKFGMLMDWAKEKISPAANKLADTVEKASPEAAAKIRGIVASESPEKPETPQQQLAKKLNSEFSFDAKDIETTQTQDFKMEELMGEKVDFAALKTKYKFTEGVKLEDLAKQIKEANKYNPAENKATKVWDFLLKLQTPPQQPKTETKK